MDEYASTRIDSTMTSRQSRVEIVWKSDMGPEGPVNSRPSDGVLVPEPQRAEPERRRTSTGAISVYRLYDAADSLLYVGITNRGFHRLHEHSKGKAWWSEVVRAEFEHHETRAEALAHEAKAIQDETPRHNVYLPSGPPGEPQNIHRGPHPVNRTLAVGLVRARGDESKSRGQLFHPRENLVLIDRQARRHFKMSGTALIAALKSGEISKTDERLWYVANLLDRVY